MNFTLVSYTTPVQELKELGVDTPADLVAFCARVSNPSNQLNKDTAEKLIKFLIRNKHWSPLEMVDATFEIETTRDIARQILRHRSFCFQEFSQRYAESFGFQFSEARLQDTSNRQNSIDTGDVEIKEFWTDAQKQVIELVDSLYNEALEKGIAKEVARKILPEGLTLSRMYMKGSLRSWIHYVDLRSANGTQKEHAQIARGIGKIISELFPVSWESLTSD